MPILKQGLVQLYTGHGKGKTTAAFGLAWRMMGHGGRVYICQFLKPFDINTGETSFAVQFSNQLTLQRLKNKWDMIKIESDIVQHEKMSQDVSTKLVEIFTIAQSGEYDLIILDEIILCLAQNIVKQEDISSIINNRAAHTELVITGRDAPDWLITAADLVTEMNLIKHPFNKGIYGRAGIEF